MAIDWVEKVPVARIDGDSVMVETCSGDQVRVSRLSRHAFRTFCERGIRLLNEADRHGCHIIELPRREVG